MKLYAANLGHMPRRVEIYLRLKGIDSIEVQSLDLLANETRTPEFLKKNPAGTVPVLETDDHRFILDSVPIMFYLEELHPHPPMRGTTPAQSRRVDAQCSLINDYLYFRSLSLVHTHPYLKRRLPRGPAHDVDIVSGPLWRMRLEQISELMGTSRFLAGDEPTIPDCMLFPTIELYYETYDLFIPSHLQTLRSWYERFRTLTRMPLLLPEGFHDELIARYGGRI